MKDSAQPPDPRVGAIIQGRYEILDFVASGGMGVVYRGQRLQLGRPVAIKFLHPQIAAQQSFLERFEVEARAMSRLSHPNCVSVIDFGVEGVPFLVMDFVSGQSLRYLLEHERLEAPRALGFVRQILSGLAHAHAHGIIHRDLKPENIVISDAPGLVDHVRILDFGLAKLSDGPALTVGMAIGTPSYMAPEQTLKEGTIDARTDLYGVGILLFEMLTGDKPFRADKLVDLLLMQRSQPAPRMNAVLANASFSEALEAVVAKALAKAPGERFANADEMLAALAQVPEAATTPPGVVAEAGRPGPAEPAMATAPDKTLVDQTILDPAMVEKLSLDATTLDVSRRQAPTTPSGPSAREAGPTWTRPVLALWKRRRRWILVGLAVSLALLIASTFARGRRHAAPKEPTPQAQAPSVAPLPAANDELAPMSRDATPGLAEVAQLVRLGLYDQAITILQEIRRDYPRSAYASFLLSVAYFGKLWWSVGAQHALATFQLDPAYRRSPALAKAIIHSLGSDSFWEKGGTFMRFELPDLAEAYLGEAAQSDRRPKVRARAAQILASIVQRPPAPGNR